MRLALLGYPIQHSLSPYLYREFLGERLDSYDLLEYETSEQIPGLTELAEKYDGLSITSPYKKFFYHDVVVTSPLVKELGAINTISFRESGFYGTNTDVTAVEAILLDFKKQFPELSLILLGDGVMARLTILVCRALKIPFDQYSRKKGDNLSFVDLSQKRSGQTIVVNCCSRDFIFQGPIHPDFIFWDYNYSYLPHQSSLPSKVKSYVDGQGMLRLQALAAIQFWSGTEV